MTYEEQLHELIDALNDPQAGQALVPLVEQVQQPISDAATAWPPAFFSSFDGEPDLAERSQAILRKRFGEQDHRER